jgi:predicted GIY-YIG superfamily endonuclease
MNRDDLSQLACSDGAFYIGSAGDVAKRLAEHGGPKGANLPVIIHVRD